MNIRFIKILLIYLALSVPAIGNVYSQPVTYSNSADILLKLKKLNVLGSALYIAAHPDDENTRLIAYLSGERLLRTAYLSLTRGDGGQNLIGEELGIPLGLIRTQELLAARRIDGADQFFSRAFDFGFSKNPEETFRIWGKEKILGDAVRIIRSVKPDIIIARFPEDERAGHGHHSASGIVAREAYFAAADPSRFPEQLEEGLEVWQAKRLLWNTYSFGSNSTIREDQFKVDVGAYNPLMGMSYGEVSALSRSEHKSQGFGVPTARGEAYEYFETIAGERPVKDILEGVVTNWSRIGLPQAGQMIEQIIASYDPSAPAQVVPALLQVYRLLTQNEPQSDSEDLALHRRYASWKNYKAAEVADIIRKALGLHIEATANRQFAVEGDSLQVRFSIINRSSINISNVVFNFNGNAYPLASELKNNIPGGLDMKYLVPKAWVNGQPYWLRLPAEKGSFNVENSALIGHPQNPEMPVRVQVHVNGVPLSFKLPLQYKYTDPVRGEILQPVITVPQVVVNVQPQVILSGLVPAVPQRIAVQLQTFGRTGKQSGHIIFKNGAEALRFPFTVDMEKDKLYSFSYNADSVYHGRDNTYINVSVQFENGEDQEIYDQRLQVINYAHIPTVHFFEAAGFNLVKEPIRTSRSRIGYIRGAGDRVPEALQAMGYEVSFLDEQHLTMGGLQHYDAIITGIRAYNVHEFLSAKYDVLMNYVRQGGSLIVQYNTNSMFGPVRARMAPFPFNISRNRVTNEVADVTFAEPRHRVLNYPNKLSSADFSGWVQERGLYFADQLAAEFKAPLRMNDEGENPQSGSLIIADYGKGKFVYTGLSFFRQLPAGVPGAFKLMANIIGLNK